MQVNFLNYRLFLYFRTLWKNPPLSNILAMPLIEDTSYTSPYLVANKHLATLVPNLFRIPRGVKYERERIDTVDGDFLDLDWSTVGSKKCILVSHGLGGNSRRAYIVGMVKHFNKLGWDAVAWNCRGCSGEPNRKRHYYHPGQTDDIGQVIHHMLDKGGYETVALIGFSLGGAYTLRYIGEKADQLPSELKKAVVFSVPTDLGSCSEHLSFGALAWYGKAFLFRYKQKMMAKEKMYPGIHDFSLWEQVKTLNDFDRVFNVRWYGMENVEEFYEQGSPNRVMDQINIPTLVVNAANDPFLPPSCYPKAEAERNDKIYLEIPEMGGHVGFMTLKWKGIFWSETRTSAFLEDLE